MKTAKDFLVGIPRLFAVRKFKRLIFGTSVTIVGLIILRMYLILPRRAAVTSSVSCKAKLPQIVFPKDLDRLKYLSGIHKDPYVLEEDYFNAVATMTYMCNDQIHLGPPEDGGWEVCFEGRFAFKAPCLVYSFGIGNDFRFERGIEDLAGCEVHAFDPSMGTKSYNYSDNGHFHALGLDSANHVTAYTGWRMRTLQSIMQELGHEGKTIDFLKMDIEFAEWPALYNIISTKLVNQVRQLAVETHTPEMDIHIAPDHKCTWGTVESLAFMQKIIILLNQAGFQLFYSRTNYRTQYVSKLTEKARYCCHNLHFVNLKHPANEWKPK